MTDDPTAPTMIDVPGIKEMDENSHFTTVGFASEELAIAKTHGIPTGLQSMERIQFFRTYLICPCAPDLDGVDDTKWDIQFRAAWRLTSTATWDGTGVWQKDREIQVIAAHSRSGGATYSAPIDPTNNFGGWADYQFPEGMQDMSKRERNAIRGRFMDWNNENEILRR